MTPSFKDGVDIDFGHCHVDRAEHRVAALLQIGDQLLDLALDLCLQPDHESFEVFIDQGGIQLAVEIGLDGRDLAAIGIRTWALWR